MGLGRRRWPGSAAGSLPWLPWLVLGLLLAASAVRIGAQYQGLSRARFTDFEVFLVHARRAQDVGVLYDTRQAQFFLPGSPCYKFPPPLAAFLTLIPRGMTPKPAHVFAIASAGILLASLALLIASHRPSLPRALLGILVFLNWYPFYESLAGPQLEPLILFLLALALFWARRGRQGRAGVPLGVAFAFKAYPAGLLGYFALHRRWRTIAGAAGGALATLALAALVLPLRHTSEYFLSILPRLGGTALDFENLSALGNLGRLSTSILAGGEKARALSEGRTVLESCGVSGAQPLSLALLLVLLAPVALATFRAVRRSGTPVFPASESLGLALTCCLYVPLFPSSWANYQTLLALPLLIAVTLAPAPRRDPAAWILIGLATFSGVFVTDSLALYETHPEVCTLIRSLIPAWLWASLLRIYRARGVGTGPATN